ncbi:MAG TPA: 4-(cytidine 5'-diphospho)-2-C-methyl-D-erythritol kinase [Pyrinomonadaceae bacterium]
MDNPTLILSSFAKINWSLRVLGKREDGYHDVSTVLQTISLADELHITSRNDDRFVLTCTDPAIPTNDENLVIQAGLLLRENIGGRSGADIELIKHIPSQAGLGGASSNAAAAILAFTHLWKIDNVDLVGIASRIGSDVPFFLTGGRALGEGTGTTITPLTDCETKYLIIVSPTVRVSTADAYRAMDARSLTSLRSDPILTVSFAEPVSSDCDLSALHNDFEAVIFEIEPEIERAKTALLKSGADRALLAGSGSSVFGIFANIDARQNALERLESEPGWRVHPCETLARNEYLARIGVSQSRL